ncbi:long-chain-fatty-acid--CoA ligase [Variovorax paradoxus]|nr:long-chain-fatty-acid--CoA ligase [Variovorax paradoxus]MBT2301945.1 long-chain-fatty-acid--CoA ligase [Variovorax paradoxus]
MQVTQILRQALMEQPDRKGTVYNGRSRTWREIGERVPRMAAALRALGAREGDCVAALAMNSDCYLELFFSIPWCGAAFAPLNIRWSVPENQFALRDSGARILFVDDAFLAEAQTLKGDADLTLIYMGEKQTPEGMLSYEDLMRAHEPIADADRKADDLYIVLYTSGTTLQSKGVALSHRNVISVSVAFLATLPHRDNLTHLHVGGMFHLSGAGPAWYITMSAGTHVILPKFEPVPVMEAITEHKVTNCVLVPTMINMLLNQPTLKQYDLSSVRTCVYGGSPMPEAIMKAAMRDLPTWGFHQIYGMTETAGYATAFKWHEHLIAVERFPERMKSAGRPVVGMQVRIARPDGSEAPVRETGEIQIRGDNVMTRYFNNEKASAESLVNSWMRSGDAGYMDEDGFVYIADRLKDMIVTGGENVYSVDVERALYQHPSVREAAVVGIPSEKWGEAVHAIVVLKDGMSATADELMAHCRSLIGGYKCPRSVEFRSEALPTTPIGKIRKNVLRDAYWQGRTRKI